MISSSPSPSSTTTTTTTTTKTTTPAADSNIDNDTTTAHSRSCIAALDVLWHCFTPANQFTTYYRIGLASDCQPEIRGFFNCLSTKIKDPFSPEVQAIAKLEQDHIWKFKTPEESKATFPH